MKKILITRKLIKESEDKALKTFNAQLNSNDELYSQSKVIDMSQGCDGILSSLTDKMDKETINELPWLRVNGHGGLVSSDTAATCQLRWRLRVN